MKKLIVAVFAASMMSSVFADAQAYEMQITVKTTSSVPGHAKMVSCDCRTDTNDLYRAQKTMKIKGLIWGCDCGTLTKGIPYTSSTNAYGCFFWNETTRKPLNLKLSWQIANRIGAKATDMEATWYLMSNESETNHPSFFLMGSGFGKLKDTSTKDPCRLVTSIVNSLNGNCAGWMTPGSIVTTKATAGTCSWCEKVAGTEEQVAVARGWGLCSDCEDGTGSDLEGSAAFGTWKIKFNKKVSKKMESKISGEEMKITDFYDFPSYVRSVMD